MNSTRSATMTAADANPAPDWAPTGRTVTLLACAGVLVVGQLYTVLALYHSMARGFGVPASSVAWTSTAFGFAYAFGFLVAGPLSDRLGPRKAITICLIATAATTALVPAATTLAVAVTFRALQGLTAALFAPAAYAYATTHIRPQRRAAALSVVAASLLAAAVIMQVAAQLIGAALGWRAVFLLCALAFLVLAAFSWRILLPAAAHRTVRMRDAFAAMPRLLTTPRLTVLYLGAMTLLGGFVAVYASIALVGPRAVTGSPGALLALRASSLPAMVAVPLAAPLLARTSPVRRIAAAMTTAALAVLAAGFAAASPVGLAVAVFVFVTAVLVAAPAYVEAIGAHAGAHRGSATALYAFAMFIGGSVESQLVGNFSHLGFFPIVIGVSAVLGVGALLGFVSVRRP
ncbi:MULTISPECIES: MFS transporter [Streptomyces]|uniref:MFS transporter n=1 Tax=Streptomyces canarius TaxID=285453 RepID=A0ABQ3D8E4_9ACTN|nr:MFS transporter [Streptomyces canarius]GHA65600.1 MFS transporter [Streptomyces canarius]